MTNNHIHIDLIQQVKFSILIPPKNVESFFLKIGLLTQVSKFIPNVNISIFNKSCKYILPITFQIQQSHVLPLFYRINNLNLHVFKSTGGKMSPNSCSQFFDGDLRWRTCMNWVEDPQYCLLQARQETR